MQASCVQSTRQVSRYVNRTILHASCVRVGSTLAKDARKYSDTLLLPKTSLPMRHDAVAVERALQTRPDCNYTGGRFAALKSSVIWPLTRNHQSEHLGWTSVRLHDGPPYANGRLHMGNCAFCLRLDGVTLSLSKVTPSTRS